MNKAIPFSQITNLSLVGKGAFSHVFSGNYQNTIVAVKRFADEFLDHAALNENYVAELFEREISILKKIPVHENIILYLGQTENGVVLEFISGVFTNKLGFSATLNTLYQRRQTTTIPYRTRMFYAMQLAAGLAALANANIIHCDLNPKNILVNSDDVIKIADFGLAQTSVNNKAVHSTRGAPLYRAPELYLHHDASLASDAYVLGLLLYEFHTHFEAWRGLKKLDDLTHVILRKYRPMYSDVTHQNRTLEILSFKLCRESPKNRMNAFVAHRHLMAMNARLIQSGGEQFRDEPLIAHLKTFFSDDPHHFWLQAVSDRNQEILINMMNDPEFNKDWLFEKIDQEYIAIKLLREHRIEIVKYFIKLGLCIELLRQMSNNVITFLGYLLNMGLHDLTMEILQHPILSIELFNEFFSREVMRYFWHELLLPEPDKKPAYKEFLENRNRASHVIISCRFFQHSHLNLLREEGKTLQKSVRQTDEDLVNPLYMLCEQRLQETTEKLKQS